MWIWPLEEFMVFFILLSFFFFLGVCVCMYSIHRNTVWSWCYRSYSVYVFAEHCRAVDKLTIQNKFYFFRYVVIIWSIDGPQIISIIIVIIILFFAGPNQTARRRLTSFYSFLLFFFNVRASQAKN